MTSSMYLLSFSSSALLRSEYSKSIPLSLVLRRTLAEFSDNVNAHSGRSPGFGVRSRRGETPMKIASFQVTTLAVPEDDPLANMPEDPNRKRPTVILRLRTDSGIEGIGVTLYGGRVTRSLHAMMEDLCAGIVGED